MQFKHSPTYLYTLYNALPLLLLCPCSLSLAVSAAKDAAGNVDFNTIQQMKQMGEAFVDETSKKDD